MFIYLIARIVLVSVLEREMVKKVGINLGDTTP